MKHYEILAARRKELKMQYAELSEKSGVPISSAKRILTGQTPDPRIETLKSLAYAMGLTLEDLDGNTKSSTVSKNINTSKPKFKTVPIIGTIGAGDPLYCEQEYQYSYVPENYQCDFILTCGGDSMQPTIMKGEMVMFIDDPNIDDGQIAAIYIYEDNCAVLKRIYHREKGAITLKSDNEAYSERQLNHSEYRILGKAVGSIRHF